jgi:hypothetical protein
MLNLYQLREYVVRPALEGAGIGGRAAVQLVMATGMAESGFQYIDQVDRAGRPGPAYGLWQMEEATHDDIWRWLGFRADLAADVRSRMILGLSGPLQLHGNHFYGAIMCRLHYMRFPDPLPNYGDARGMAAFWKKRYNTAAGAGTIEGFLAKTKPVFDMKN